MSSTVLEQTRAVFEDLDRLEQAVVVDMLKKPKSHVGSVLQQHRIAERVKRIEQRARDGKKLFEDEDGARKDEISNMSSGNVFSKFYDSLREVKDYHRKHPKQIVDADLEENVDALVSFSEPKFAGEESYGRYLDLHQFYNEWINMKGNPNRDVDYLNFLRSFFVFHNVPLSLKTRQEYSEYLQKLLDYLIDFQARSQPLMSHTQSTQQDKIEQGFEERWQKGQIPGWVSSSTPNGTENGDVEMDASDELLDSVKTVEELEFLGLDQLKQELMDRGLKCGGNLHQRAQRLFSIKGLSKSEIPSSIKAGAPKRAKTLSDEEIKANSKFKRTALLETRIEGMGDLLSDTIDATLERTTKNQARTWEEIQAQHEEEEGMSEEEDEEDEEDSDSSDEDRPITNPLNIPLGYDGKPIPYWLYKLHGLGIEYKCEICGNYSYWGRRNFERHFQEWRHANSMRRLQIPNTKHFHEITNIEDALTLYAKIKGQLLSKVWKPEQEEEFEDSQGNVFPKKTYDDLARQGLL